MQSNQQRRRTVDAIRNKQVVGAFTALRNEVLLRDLFGCRGCSDHQHERAQDQAPHKILPPSRAGEGWGGGARLHGGVGSLSPPLTRRGGTESDGAVLCKELKPAAPPPLAAQRCARRSSPRSNP